MRDFAKLQTSPWARQILGEITAALLLGLLLAWFGPFRTDERDLLSRMAYWIPMAIGWLVITAAVGFVLARSDRLTRIHRYSRRALTLLLSAIPGLLMVVPATRALTGWRPTMWEIVELYGAIVLLGALVSYASDAITSIVGKLQISFAGPQPARASPPIAPPTTRQLDVPRLIKRLPPQLRSPLLCLSMEDHYVRVRTDAGASLLLMTLSDAVDELDGLAGARVHRSWWVASRAVEAFEKKGRTVNLRLTDGTIVPVSQPYRSIAAEMADADV